MLLIQKNGELDWPNLAEPLLHSLYCGKVVVKDYMVLRADMSSGWIKDKRHVAYMKWRMPEVNSDV